MLLPRLLLLSASLMVVLPAFLPDTGNADFQTNYFPFRTEDTTIAHQYVLDMKKRLDTDLASIKTPDRQITNDLKELYTYRFEEIEETLKDDKILLDNDLAPYLQFILKEILAANPQLDTNIRLLLYRTADPNAATWGEGTIFFNLGLLTRLENESQIAFVLCHELAHHYSNHVNQSLLKKLTVLYSKETERQLKDVASSEYNTYTKFKKLLDDLSFNFSRHSRDHETEADSIALTYLAKTRFDATESMRCLAILDSVDKAKYPQLIDLKKYFNSPQFPYKGYWGEYTKSDMWHASPEDEENADSLKTHPDCPKRIAAVERQLKSSGYSKNGKIKSVKGDAKYHEFLERTDFEMVESSYHNKDIDDALYLSLLLLDKYPDNIYLHAMVGKCFYQMYKYQKDHALGKIVLLPDPRFDENFDRLLTFIHQLRLTEVAGIGFYYLENLPATYQDDENFLLAYYLCSKMNNNTEAMSRTKTKYLTKYPKGKFKNDFE